MLLCPRLVWSATVAIPYPSSTCVQSDLTSCQATVHALRSKRGSLGLLAWHSRSYGLSYCLRRGSLEIRQDQQLQQEGEGLDPGSSPSRDLAPSYPERIAYRARSGALRDPETGRVSSVDSAGCILLPRFPQVETRQIQTKFISPSLICDKGGRW